MVQISVITSLYRTEAFLPTYSARAQMFFADLAAAGIDAELVLVANDTTETERELLETLAQHVPCQVLHVPRETIYASWNRGVQAAQGDVVSFWGVDDERFADAIIAGLQMLTEEYSVIYFPFIERVRVDWFGIFSHAMEFVRPALPYKPDRFQSVMRAGPFFLARRSLFETVGYFDANMRVSGDYDWIARATHHTAMSPCDVIAGRFDTSHGGNLSQGANPYHLIEDNIIRLRQQARNPLRSADPERMRKAWEEWGHEGLALTAEQENYLWGEGAQERYEQFQANFQPERMRKRRRQALRHWLRWLPF